MADWVLLVVLCVLEICVNGIPSTTSSHVSISSGRFTAILLSPFALVPLPLTQVAMKMVRKHNCLQTIFSMNGLP